MEGHCLILSNHLRILFGCSKNYCTLKYNFLSVEIVTKRDGECEMQQLQHFFEPAFGTAHMAADSAATW